MRIAYLTAGGAGMYCGSCLRDNALAAALIDKGVEVQLIPTYTPITTDEMDVSQKRVFLGGINIYLRQKSRIFRALPKFLFRFLDHPWVISRLTSMNVETDARELGELTVSMLKGAQGEQKVEFEELVNWLSNSMKPTIINLSNILIAGCVPELKEKVNVPILVTLQGDDVFLDDLVEPYKTQAFELIKKLIPSVDGFIVFTEFYKNHMRDYFGIPEDKFQLVPLGIQLNDFPPVDQPIPQQKNSKLTIGYFARLCPEKGLHHLIDAFIKLKSKDDMKDVQLKIAGWLSKKDEGYLAEQIDKIKKADLNSDFSHEGVLEREEKIKFLSNLDVLSVPTVYKEPKGLFVLESLACEVPVVQPEHGSFPELLDKTQGGLLFEPGNTDQLTENLYRLLTQPELRKELGKKGREAVHREFTSLKMAERTLDLYKSFQGDP